MIDWIQKNGVTHLGFSYRLDPMDGVAFFEKVFASVRAANRTVLRKQPVVRLLFAGVPAACSALALAVGLAVYRWGLLGALLCRKP